jgi:uncharacterized protein (TIGR00290 family)
MKTILGWSTGKDSAWALHILRRTPGIDVCGLMTTVNERFDRVAMHGVRRELAQAQARATGLPLHIVSIPHPCPNAIYEERMAAFVLRMRQDAIEAMAFGDLFLEDIRAYRQRQLLGSGITPLFPIWQPDTHRLAKQMLEGGLRARIVCLDPRRAPSHLVGRDFDWRFLDDLPATIDPCGENGEFHTFAYDGPMFDSPITIRTGVTVEREGYVFSDLVMRPVPT